MVMQKYGFKQSNSDHTLFIKHKRNKVNVLIVYVNDMITTGDDKEEILRLQEALATDFEMRNLGGLKYVVGIEVAWSREGIFLSQRKYVLDVLIEVGMLECNQQILQLFKITDLENTQTKLQQTKEDTKG
jgi:hypothetical protein